MTLKKGITEYKLRKPIDRLMEAYIDEFPEKPCRSIVILDTNRFNEMLKLSQSHINGEPRVVSFDHKYNRFRVYPIPNRKVKLLVRGIKFVDQ